MILGILICKTVSSRKDTIYNHLILRKFNFLNIPDRNYLLTNSPVSYLSFLITDAHGFISCVHRFYLPKSGQVVVKI
ncbi:hypothetical protein QF042_004957 [Pedobacter sp. W3I1]|nr:hypothetical protein [Pedobacter sp. W3I1]